MKLHAITRFVRRAVWRRWSEVILGSAVVPPTPVVRLRIDAVIEAITAETIGGGEPPRLELVRPRDVVERLRRGDTCFVARVGDRTVAYCWVGFGAWNLDDIGIRLRLPENEGYLYDLYASPAYRGKRIFPAILAEIHAFVLKHGASRMYARVSRSNLAVLIGWRWYRVDERVTLDSWRVAGFISLYGVSLVEGDGQLFGGLMTDRAQFRPGVLWWRHGDRRGIRASLPRGGRQQAGGPAVSSALPPSSHQHDRSET